MSSPAAAPLPTSARRARTALVLTAVLAVVGSTGAAGAAEVTAGALASPAVSPTLVTVDQARQANAPSHVVAADLTWRPADVVAITLQGTTAKVAAKGAGAVTVAPGLVTITKSGTYRLTGKLTGQVVVDVADKGLVRLVLAGATITSRTTSPLVVAKAGRAVVWLEQGSKNSLSDATTYTYPDAETDEPDAALFSKADLTIAGTGQLQVKGNAYDGIASKDGLAIVGGKIVVKAVDDGVRGKDYVYVSGGSLAVTAGGNGVTSTEEDDADKGFVDVSGGTLAVTSGDDGLDAVSDVVVSGGTLKVTAGGGHTVTGEDAPAAKALKAGTLVAVGGGKLTLDASDDAINCDTGLSITGGTLKVSAAAKALQADVSVDVAGGTISVPAAGDGISSTAITIAGGTTSLVTGDDGLNASVPEETPDAAASIAVTGGTLVVDPGGDGLTSDGALTIAGGTTVVNGTRVPGGNTLAAKGAFTVTGGTLLAAGRAKKAVAPGEGSTAGWVELPAPLPAGTVVHLSSSGVTGSPLVTFRTGAAVEQVVVASPKLVNGVSYLALTGGNGSGKALGGLYPKGSLAGAKPMATVTAGVRPTL